MSTEVKTYQVVHSVITVERGAATYKVMPGQFIAVTRDEAQHFNKANRLVDPMIDDWSDGEPGLPYKPSDKDKVETPTQDASLVNKVAVLEGQNTSLRSDMQTVLEAFKAVTESQREMQQQIDNIVAVIEEEEDVDGEVIESVAAPAAKKKGSK